MPVTAWVWRKEVRSPEVGNVWKTENLMEADHAAAGKEKQAG